MSAKHGRFVIKQFIPKSNSSVNRRNTSIAKRQRPRVEPNQRKRIKTACHPCRLDKVKCEGGVPCRRCGERSLACGVRDDHAKGQKPLSQEERVALHEAVLKRMLGMPTISDEKLRALAEDPDRHIPQGRASSRDFDQGWQVTGAEDSPPEDPSLANFTRRLQTRIGDPHDLEPQLDLNQLCRSPSPEHGLVDDHVETIAGRLPPRHLGEYLVSTFLRFVQCNSFCVHERWVAETLRLCYTDRASLGTIDVPRIATLLMLMALGTQFVDLHKDCAEVSPSTSGASLSILGHTYYEAVSALLPVLIQINSFESVRCVMLLAVYLFPHDLAGHGYSLLGLALHMALRRGMHRHNTALTDDTAEDDNLHWEVERRIWWTLYTFYPRACIFQGRPMTLAHESVSTNKPTFIQDLEPTHRESNLGNQTALINITLLLERITKALWVAKTSMIAPDD